jgi:hypothetical protein
MSWQELAGSARPITAPAPEDPATTAAAATGPVEPEGTEKPKAPARRRRQGGLSQK